MDQNQSPIPAPTMSQESSVAKAMDDRQMLAEIYKFTKQTRNYMRWQMYITLILVVLPLLASLFILPFAFKSLEQAYIQPLQGSSGSPQSVQGLLQGVQ